jgi:hypothetical protein
MPTGISPVFSFFWQSVTVQRKDSTAVVVASTVRLADVRCDALPAASWRSARSQRSESHGIYQCSNKTGECGLTLYALFRISTIHSRAIEPCFAKGGLHPQWLQIAGLIHRQLKAHEDLAFGVQKKRPLLKWLKVKQVSLHLNATRTFHNNKALSTTSVWIILTGNHIA